MLTYLESDVFIFCYKQAVRVPNYISAMELSKLFMNS